MRLNVLGNVQDASEPRLQPGDIEIIPIIVVPDQAAGPSNQTRNVNCIPNFGFND